MNERIIELAIEARKYAESKPDIYQVAYDKKFAELIVRECVTTIDNEIGRLTEYSNSIDDAYMKHNVDICIEKCLDNIHNIKEHFGVVE